MALIRGRADPSELTTRTGDAKYNSLSLAERGEGRGLSHLMKVRIRSDRNRNGRSRAEGHWQTGRELWFLFSYTDPRFSPAMGPATRRVPVPACAPISIMSAFDSDVKVTSISYWSMFYELVTFLFQLALFLKCCLVSISYSTAALQAALLLART